MTPPDLKRKLTAILSADVKGYSRLMGDDEEWTVRTLSAYREVIKNLVGQHRGRVVDAPGDNLLAEFASVVDAVQCAVEVQQVLKAKNAMLPENRRMEFRIGINLGDVIEEGDAIYGDGVNIAARMEGLAQPGGICLSGSAYEQIENKLPLQYEYLGEHEVKNIAKPVRVYRAQIEPEAAPLKGAVKKPLGKRVSKAALGIIAVVVVAGAASLYQFVLRPSHSQTDVASREKTALPLPDLPSIAVLPFVNMSDDPKQDYLADGFAEAIIDGLSKCPYIVVIARNSSFTYKGKPIKVQQVADDLGVRHVLEGSVRRSGDAVRVTVQLIDAIKGHYLWSERYDGGVKDIFALEDKITMQVLTGLRVKLTEGETALLYAKGTKNLPAYLKVLEGDERMRQYNKEANALALRLYQEAIKLDPNYAMAYTRLSRTYTTDLYFSGAGESREEMLSKAMKSAQKAIELDNTLAEGYAAVSYVYITMGQHDKAIEAGERAVRHNPNSPTALFQLAMCLVYAGRSEEALRLLRQAIRLNPFVPIYYIYASVAYTETGRYQEGIDAVKKSLKFAPNDLYAYVQLSILYVRAGLEDEARRAAAEVMRINPTFSVKGYTSMQPWKEAARKERLIDDLHKAGLK